MSFSEKLRLEREKHGYNQKEFAEKLNLPKNTYNGYETGKRIPNLEVVKHIADNLDVSVDYLLDRFKYSNKIESIEERCIVHEPEITYKINEYDFNNNIKNKLDNLNKVDLNDAIRILASKVESTYLLKLIYLNMYSTVETYELINKAKDTGLVTLRNHIAHSRASDEELLEFVKIHKAKI